MKDKIQLLDIFHEQKKTLAAGDMGKNRDLIRAIANGVVMRAQKLQKTADDAAARVGKAGASNQRREP